MIPDSSKQTGINDALQTEVLIIGINWVMMRLPHKSRLKLEFWSNSFVHLYALRPPYSNPYLSKCFSFLTLSDILHFLFFFDVLDLTEELFDKVGPAPFKMSY